MVPAAPITPFEAPKSSRPVFYAAFPGDYIMQNELSGMEYQTMGGNSRLNDGASYQDNKASRMW